MRITSPARDLLVIAFLAIPVNAIAMTMEACLAIAAAEASDDTTVGELRRQCQYQIDTQRILTEAEAGKPVEYSPIERRYLRELSIRDNRFAITAHRPNYLLLAAYDASGVNPAGLSGNQGKDTETKFQVSMKFPLIENLLGEHRGDIYAAYTNRSFWQVYNSELSSPFRETNHEPEVWAQFTPSWEIFGFRNLANSVGVVHQSNGQGGVLSRSWNRVYANFVFAKGNFAIGFKPWFRISEDASDDDNPDIIDYLGHYELRAGYKWNEQVFSVMSRNNLESGFDKGAFEFGWSFPLWKYPYLKGYIQYFRGYGESLIDYNRRVNKIGIGVSLTDWL